MKNLCVQCSRPTWAMTEDGRYAVCCHPDCPNYGLAQISQHKLTEFIATVEVCPGCEGKMEEMRVGDFENMEEVVACPDVECEGSDPRWVREQREIDKMMQDNEL